MSCKILSWIEWELWVCFLSFSIFFFRMKHSPCFQPCLVPSHTLCKCLSFYPLTEQLISPFAFRDRSQRAKQWLIGRLLYSEERREKEWKRLNNVRFVCKNIACSFCVEETYRSHMCGIGSQYVTPLLRDLFANRRGSSQCGAAVEHLMTLFSKTFPVSWSKEGIMSVIKYEINNEN